MGFILHLTLKHFLCFSRAYFDDQFVWSRNISRAWEYSQRKAIRCLMLLLVFLLPQLPQHHSEDISFIWHINQSKFSYILVCIRFVNPFQRREEMPVPTQELCIAAFIPALVCGHRLIPVLSHAPYTPISSYARVTDLDPGTKHKLLSRAPMR